MVRGRGRGRGRGRVGVGVGLGLTLTLTVTPNQVHDVWGGTARASEPLRVVAVQLDTALVGSVLAQIDDLSAEALASNSSQGNAAATQLVGALAETLNTQGEEAKAEGNVSGVTDTALVELR